ncbi:hypothetical protein YC2023_122610 [Brassica napus]
MVLIFHSFKGFSDLNLDMQVFHIWETYGLQKFQATSRKSSRRLPGSLPGDFQEVFQKSSDEVFFHIKWSLSISL